MDCNLQYLSANKTAFRQATDFKRNTTMKMMKFYLVLSVLISTITETIYAQSELVEKKNAVYAEFLGPAGVYSFNYDRILYRPHKWYAISAGAGFSVYNNITLDIPFHASVLVGPKSHKLEVGGGLQPEIYFNSKYETEKQLICFLKIGYRYQRLSGGPMLGFSINPLFYPKTNWHSTWVSIDLGWTF